MYDVSGIIESAIRVIKSFNKYIAYSSNYIYSISIGDIITFSSTKLEAKSTITTDPSETIVFTYNAGSNGYMVSCGAYVDGNYIDIDEILGETHITSGGTVTDDYVYSLGYDGYTNSIVYITNNVKESESWKTYLYIIDTGESISLCNHGSYSGTNYIMGQDTDGRVYVCDRKLTYSLLKKCKLLTYYNDTDIDSKYIKVSS